MNLLLKSFGLIEIIHFHVNPTANFASFFHQKKIVLLQKKVAGIEPKLATANAIRSSHSNNRTDVNKVLYNCRNRCLKKLRQVPVKSNIFGFNIKKPKSGLETYFWIIITSERILQRICYMTLTKMLPVFCKMAHSVLLRFKTQVAREWFLSHIMQENGREMRYPNRL